MNSKYFYLLAFAMVAPAFASASEIASTPNTSVLKITNKISRDGPQLSVEAISTESFSNWHYEIRIAVEGNPLQVIPIRNGQALKNSDFQLVDLNGDGFLDIMIASGMDHRDKPWFKTLIYSQDTKQYQWMGLKAAADPEINKAEQGNNLIPRSLATDAALAHFRETTPNLAEHLVNLGYPKPVVGPRGRAWHVFLFDKRRSNPSYLQPHQIDDASYSLIILGTKGTPVVISNKKQMDNYKDIPE